MLLKEKLPFMKASCDATDCASSVISTHLKDNYERVYDVFDRQLYFICDEPFVAMGNSIEIEKIEESGKVIEIRRNEISFFIFMRNKEKLFREGGLLSHEGILENMQREINAVVLEKCGNADLLPPLKEFIISLEISSMMA